MKPEAYRVKDNGYVEDNIPHCKQAQTVLTDLARRRLELIQRANISTNQPALNRNHGRFMLHILSMSEWSALSEDCSDGFFDDIDLPPWDTWVMCIPVSYKSNIWDKTSTSDMILSWVPAVFSELANEGMLCNPVDCIFWASEYRQGDYRSDVLEWLDSQGLLF